MGPQLLAGDSSWGCVITDGRHGDRARVTTLLGDLDTHETVDTTKIMFSQLLLESPAINLPFREHISNVLAAVVGNIIVNKHPNYGSYGDQLGTFLALMCLGSKPEGCRLNLRE